MTEEEEFFAWLDGELPAADATRVEARVAASHTLTAEAEAHRAMGAGLRAAFETVMTSQTPVASFIARRAERAGRPIGVPQWAAMAATLVIGIGLGTIVGAGGETASPIVVDGRQMVAAASLDRALTRQLASTDQQGATTRVGLTFRNQRGSLCRSFSDKAASGVACRSGSHWRIEGLYGASGSSVGAYRMAAGSDPRVAELIDGMIIGEPLDAAGEASAMQSGWK